MSKCKCPNRTIKSYEYIFTEEKEIYECNDCGKQHNEPYISNQELKAKTEALLERCRKYINDDNI